MMSITAPAVILALGILGSWLIPLWLGLRQNVRPKPVLDCPHPLSRICSGCLKPVESPAEEYRVDIHGVETTWHYSCYRTSDRYDPIRTGEFISLREPVTFGVSPKTIEELMR
jgi:hypothetical protein